MESLAKTFRLLELTRAQAQYGYVLAEIPKGELSDLAQHHYLVTAFAWQLARTINSLGGKLSVERVLEISLVHDLGELFGGDIAMPYAKANPAAKRKAIEFEKENHRFLSEYLYEDSKYLKALFEEASEPTSDEALVAKIADYMEVTHYKLYVHHLTKKDVGMVTNRMSDFISHMGGKENKKFAKMIVKEWEKEMIKPTEELFEKYKSEK